MYPYYLINEKKQKFSLFIEKKFCNLKKSFIFVASIQHKSRSSLIDASLSCLNYYIIPTLCYRDFFIFNTLTFFRFFIVFNLAPTSGAFYLE